MANIRISYDPRGASDPPTACKNGACTAPDTHRTRAHLNCSVVEEESEETTVVGKLARKRKAKVKLPYPTVALRAPAPPTIPNRTTRDVFEMHALYTQLI